MEEFLYINIMCNEEKVLAFMKNNSDTITTKELANLNISTMILTRMIDKKKIERVKPCLYVLKDSWGDEYFTLIFGNEFAVYSHLTALYFSDLCERVPIEYDITVKRSYSGTLRKNKNVKLYYVENEIFDLGLIEMKSPQGRIIKCYDVERCFCDLIKNKNNIYLEYLKYAFNEYYRIQKNDTKKII